MESKEPMGNVSVSMADLIDCWSNHLKTEGKPLDRDGVLPNDRAQEFFSYSLNHLDMMLEEIQEKKNCGNRSIPECEYVLARKKGRCV